MVKQVGRQRGCVLIESVLLGLIQSCVVLFTMALTMGQDVEVEDSDTDNPDPM